MALGSGVAWQWHCVCVTCDPQWPEPRSPPLCDGVSSEASPTAVSRHSAPASAHPETPFPTPGHCVGTPCQQTRAPAFSTCRGPRGMARRGGAETPGSVPTVLHQMPIGACEPTSGSTCPSRAAQDWGTGNRAHTCPGGRTVGMACLSFLSSWGVDGRLLWAHRSPTTPSVWFWAAHFAQVGEAAMGSMSSCQAHRELWRGSEGSASALARVFCPCPWGTCLELPTRSLGRGHAF